MTGANRGIGRSIARALAEHGAEVIITNKTMEGLPEVEEEIRPQVAKPRPRRVTTESYPI